METLVCRSQTLWVFIFIFLYNTIKSFQYSRVTKLEKKKKQKSPIAQSFFNNNGHDSMRFYAIKLAFHIWIY